MFLGTLKIDELVKSRRSDESVNIDDRCCPLAQMPVLLPTNNNRDLTWEGNMILKTISAMLLISLLMLLPASAGSMDPMDTIKGPIDAAIAILNDPQYKNAGTKADQRDKIWSAVKPMFDFRLISRRAVGGHWDKFSDTEKTQFSDVFADFLGNTYIDKIQGEYHNEKIVYLSQALASGRYAEVKTQILREAVQIPVYYRLIKNNEDSWHVYDIIVEGVSLVKNYRTQFASILKKETPAQLIERLNKKLTEQNQRLSKNG
jgi:phospholipid transport system substrate-binding protein